MKILFWRSGRAGLVFLVVMAIYTLGLAIGPRVSDDVIEQRTSEGKRLYCLTAIDLPGPFGIQLNCDSPLFMEMAADPARLLEPGNWRQSRPGQIWLAWLLARPISAFSSVFVAFASRDDVRLPEGATRSRAQAMADLAPGFAAYYLINLGLLGASLWLLSTSAGLLRLQPAIFWLAGCLLLFNDVTKAFLITPHSQLMNILIPVLAVSMLFRAAVGALPSLRQMLVLGAVAGVGLLAYATWLLVPVVLLACLLWVAWRQRARRSEALRLMRWFPAVGLLAVLPYALWYTHVVDVAGSMYQHEVTHDGGLVWAFKLPAAELLARLGGNAAVLLSFAAVQALPYAAFAMPALWLLWRRQVRISPGDRQTLGLACAAAAAVSLLFLAFFSLLGFLVWRYAVPLLPPWVLPMAMLNAMVYAQLPGGSARKRFVFMLTAIAVAIAVATVAKNGPWD